MYLSEEGSKKKTSLSLLYSLPSPLQHKTGSWTRCPLTTWVTVLTQLICKGRQTREIKASTEQSTIGALTKALVYTTSAHTAARAQTHHVTVSSPLIGQDTHLKKKKNRTEKKNGREFNRQGGEISRADTSKSGRCRNASFFEEWNGNLEVRPGGLALERCAPLSPPQR